MDCYKCKKKNQDEYGTELPTNTEANQSYRERVHLPYKEDELSRRREKLSSNGGRGSSVGRARDSWSGGPGLDPRCGRPLPTGNLGRCQYNVSGRDRSHGLPALSHVWQHVKLSDALSWDPSAI